MSRSYPALRVLGRGEGVEQCPVGFAGIQHPLNKGANGAKIAADSPVLEPVWGPRTLRNAEERTRERYCGDSVFRGFLLLGLVRCGVRGIAACWLGWMPGVPCGCRVAACSAAGGSGPVALRYEV